MQLSRKDPIIKLLYVTPEKVRIAYFMFVTKALIIHFYEVFIIILFFFSPQGECK